MNSKNNPDEDADLLKLGKELIDGKLRLAMQILARKSNESAATVSERVKQEIIESWEEYQQTGNHVTHEEADDWLCSLGQGKEVDIPPCHK